MARIKAGLGWLRDLPDQRDHMFSAPMAVLKALPPSVDLADKFAIYDQGRIGSCTAMALAAAVEFDRLKAQQKPAFTPSRLFIYYNERELEGDVPLDGGAYLRDGIKTLQKAGVCPEALWPYDDTPAAYQGGPFPVGSRPATRPSQACYDAAANYQITSYQRLSQTLSQLQGCLAAGYPFVFGFSVYSGWYSRSPRPAIIPLPTGDDSVIGGHAVLCVGYNNAKGLFKIRNSWGGGQGEKGYFYMPYAYLISSNLAADFWVINAVES